VPYTFFVLIVGTPLRIFLGMRKSSRERLTKNISTRAQSVVGAVVSKRKVLDVELFFFLTVLSFIILFLAFVSMTSTSTAPTEEAYPLSTVLRTTSI
jgi:hypothetical protein